jgi:glutamate synthase (NADPH/NADH) small chain
MYGIPNMKLDKEQVVIRRIKQMEAEGVKFVTNTEVGANYPAEKLLKEFDAVVICTGATKPRDLPVEGRDLKGVHFAMDFLTSNTRQPARPAQKWLVHSAKARTCCARWW